MPSKSPTSRARAVDGQIEHAQRQRQPTAADFDAVAQADEDQLDRKLAGLPELENRQPMYEGR